MKSFFQRYLLPGLLFQSLIISGGYSTGRELIEFFMSKGPVTGFLGMLIVVLTFSSVLGLTFEFARIHKSYDYRHFFQQLLGRAWVLFEFSFFAVAVLVLAVIGSASGVIFSEISGAPEFTGTILMMLAIGVLAFYGSDLIEKVISLWSFVLYAAYLFLFLLAISTLGDDVKSVVEQSQTQDLNWQTAFQYAGINLAAAPAILFGLRHIQSRREAVGAGLLAGPLAMIPALLFYVILLSQYPQVIEQEVPLLSLLAALNISAFALIFKIVIFGTYVETGVGMVHSINERIAGLLEEYNKDFTQWQRSIVALGLLLGSIYLATNIGIVDLIGKGYGTLTYAILAVYVLPLITIGLVKIVRT